MTVKTNMKDLVDSLVIGERFYISIPQPGDEKDFDYALYRNTLPEGLEVTNNAYWDLVRAGASAQTRAEVVSCLVKTVLTVVNIALTHQSDKILVFDGAIGSLAQTQWYLTAAINGWIANNKEQLPSGWGSIFGLARSSNMPKEGIKKAYQQLEETIRLDFRVEPVPRG